MLLYFRETKYEFFLPLYQITFFLVFDQAHSFEMCAREICETFVYKHSEKIEQDKN